MKYVAYYRVSTAQQGKTGLGLEAQRASVAKYLSTAGGTLVAEFTEVVSGVQDSRKELAAALRQCKAEHATLVIAKLDRLARRLSYLSSFIESEVPLVVADMPNANKFVLQMMAVLAETERDMISERTRLALSAAKARGIKLGNPNLNAARDIAASARRKRADAFAQDMSEQISTLQRQGKNLRQIAKELNSKGCKTASGGLWWPTTVSNIIKRCNDLKNPSLMDLFESKSRQAQS